MEDVLKSIQLSYQLKFLKIFSITIKELCDALRLTYQDRFLIDHIILQQQLYFSRMKSEVTPSKHMDTSWSTLIMNSKAVDVGVSDKVQATTLLCSLPLENTMFTNFMING